MSLQKVIHFFSAERNPALPPGCSDGQETLLPGVEEPLLGQGAAGLLNGCRCFEAAL